MSGDGEGREEVELPDPSTWPPDGEALLFLSWPDVKALIRGANACVEVVPLPTHDPGDYVRAEGVLRGLLTVARRRLEETVGLKPGASLDPHDWQPGQEVPVFLGREEGEAIRRATVALRILGTARGREDLRAWTERTRRTLVALLWTADEELTKGEEEEEKEP